MKNKLIKRIAFIFSLFFISLFIGILVIYLLINPAFFVPKMHDFIKEKTGYIATTKGKVKLALYPLFALDIEELTLEKPNKPDSLMVLKEVSFTAPWQFNQMNHPTWQSTIQAKTLYFQGLKANNVKTNALIKKGFLALNHFTATFYQGTLAANIQLDKSKMPQSQWEVELNQVNIELFLHDLYNATTSFTIAGFLNAHFSGSIPILNEQKLFDVMTGTLQFNVVDGAFKGLDLNYFINKGVALLKHEKNDFKRQDRTEFQQFNGTIYLTDGIAKSTDILLKAQAFTARVMGDMQLSNQILDVALQVTPINEKRFMIPLLVTGPLKNPTLSLDTLLIQTMITKEEMDKISKKIGKEIKKLPERANKILDQLFGQ